MLQCLKTIDMLRYGWHAQIDSVGPAFSLIVQVCVPGFGLAACMIGFLAIRSMTMFFARISIGDGELHFLCKEIMSSH